MSGTSAKLDSTGDSIDELVLVVHGVGDPVPGATVSSLTRCVSSPNNPIHETEQSLWIHDNEAHGRMKAVFPCHIRSMETGGQSVEFAEVFWADLSRVRQSWAGILVGLFQVVFGLRYVAYVAGDQEIRAARWLQWLGLISSRILHGPVLAVNFILAILTVELVGTELLWSHSNDRPMWTTILAAICAGCGMLAGGIFRRTTRSRVIERFWFWVLITSLLIGGLVLARSFLIPATFMGSTEADCPSSGLLWYGQTLVVLMGLLWCVLMLVVLAMAACWLAAQLHPKAYRRGLNVAMMLPVMVIGLWGQVLPMFWLCAQTAWSKIAHIHQFDRMFEQAVPLLGAQCLMCIILGAIQLVNLICYATWRPRNDVESFQRGARAPRLIVNYWVLAGAAICTTVGVSLVFLLGSIEIFDKNPTSVWLTGAMAEANKYAIAMLVPMTGLFVFSFQYLGSVLDIVLDVANHFHFQRDDEEGGMEDEDYFEDGNASFESGSLTFARRKAIHSRMRLILEYYRERCCGKTKLTIVAHSQGTVISTEVLNDPENEWLQEAFESVTLITMGSPLTHLYQHYFGNHYPELDEPFWSPLRRNVNQWINIFRIDDFVGTEIEFPESLNIEKGIRCSNEPVENCGHTHYWSDEQVLEILREKGQFFWLKDPRDLVEPSSPDSIVRFRNAA